MSLHERACLGARRHFSDWLDDQPMSWWVRLYVMCHAKVCPACRPVYRSLIATDEALAAVTRAPPDATDLSKGGP